MHFLDIVEDFAELIWHAFAQLFGIHFHFDFSDNFGFILFVHLEILPGKDAFEEVNKDVKQGLDIVLPGSFDAFMSGY